jgi:phosphoribosyl-dephospho-CoA transferase
MDWKRHTMLDISDAGRDAILAELAGDDPLLREKLGDLLLPERSGVRIPGIVRREESAPRPGCVAVGFCGSAAVDFVRMRVAAFVNPDDVVRITTPYELLSLPIAHRTLSTRALAAASAQAGALGMNLGVWGSAALEIYTGLPYTHNDSDLDLLVAATSRESLCRFLEEIKVLEERFGLRIDAEVDLPGGFGVHRKIIGKSLDGVEMLSREQILADLPH